VIDWLLEYGGPMIKLRTMTEIMDKADDHSLQRLGTEILESEKIKNTLDYFDGFQKFSSLSPRELYGLVHNTYENCFETFIKVLIEAGFKHGMRALDEKTAVMRPVYRYLLKDNPFYASIIIAYLMKMGYYEKDMMEFVSDRVDQLHRVTEKRIYDIYQKPEDVKHFPKWMEGKLILRPEYSPYVYTSQPDALPLPLQLDMEMLFALPQEYVDKDMENKISDIFGYIMKPEYQALDGNYGWMWNEECRTYHAANNGYSIPL
jgi:hypothetical protein